ncbi:MAG TPA: N-acetylglucosamine-6-phosphate deacetylase [Blastocatellia bacterium]|nr:N-acetylglucosamine-6-phosphate deacetylase [Blastocatellia bacterium]
MTQRVEKQHWQDTANDLMLHNAQVVLERELMHGGVLVQHGRIASVFSEQDKPAAVPGADIIDLGYRYLAPGMLDIHIHGGAGIDVQATDETGLEKLSEYLLSKGVTSYVPTFVPADEDSYRSSLDVVGAYFSAQQPKDSIAQAGPSPRARVLGVHFEGPFVSHNRCGALKREFFRTFSGINAEIDLVVKVVEAAGGAGVRLMTVAPEVEGGVELIRALTARGVRTFIGHTQAQPETLDSAFDAGARHITHFPNALDPLHHRKPGAVAWGLTRRDVSFDCIADLHHVDALMLRLMYQAKGSDRMALISDSIMPAGLGDGHYTVWGEPIAVRNGKTSLVNAPSDTIAGSVITMLDALKNIAAMGVPLVDAIKMSSLTPARAAGVDDLYGSIQQGKIADLIVLNDILDPCLAVSAGHVHVLETPFK